MDTTKPGYTLYYTGNVIILLYIYYIIYIYHYRETKHINGDMLTILYVL